MERRRLIAGAAGAPSFARPMPDRGENRHQSSAWARVAEYTCVTIKTDEPPATYTSSSVQPNP